MTDPVRPLPPEALYAALDPATLPFATTAEIEPSLEPIGQQRAVEAIRFGIGIRHQGYNLFALGPEGTGKSSLVRRYLEDAAVSGPVPSDWCYINNFAEPHRPRALRLPAGRGRIFRRDMERFVDDMKAAIPSAFESDEYRSRKNVIEGAFKERHENAFGALQKKAAESDVALIRTPVGLALAPMRDGEVLSPQDFKALPEEDRHARAEAIERLQQEMEDILREVPRWEKDQREQIKSLNHEVTRFAVGHLVDELKAKWSDQPAVLTHLEAVRADVVENADDFLQTERTDDSPLAEMMRRASRGSDEFRRYQVNLLVDHMLSDGDGDGDGAVRAAGAPVVEEDNPNQPNLIGRIEHIPQMGSLVTDFTLIKPGALHRANGGFLLLDARKVLTAPFAWESLKRALANKRIRIETPAEAIGWVTTVSLDPEPIPLDTKVVLLGEPELYYLLNQYDPDFRELFKVAADFSDETPRTAESALAYAHLIAGFTRTEKLRPFSRTGVARVIEYASRLADDSERLSTHMSSLLDAMREADYWAGSAGSDVVEAQHVQAAIDAKRHRADRIPERIHDMIQRDILNIETDGARAGQINGLAVSQLGHLRFGRPSRISCRVRLGKGEVVDIEREVALGGPLHSKGVLILASYLSARFAGDDVLSLQANLVFEQSYSGIDGDSASSAELYVMLSAISGIPIKQSLAVTGSVDQHGNVQAIGGVNEKIEGFFDVCKVRGLTGEQGVLIPASNVKHLMLRPDVVEAARQGRFHIYPIRTIDEGIQVLTGIEAGMEDAEGHFPIGSVNREVANRLKALSRRARSVVMQAQSRLIGMANGKQPEHPGGRARRG